MERTKKHKYKLNTSKDVRRAMTSITNKMLNDEVDINKAKCFIYACNTILQAIKLEDIEIKMMELERKYNELTK